VPILAEYRNRRGEEDAHTLVNRVATVLGLVVAAISLLGIVAAPVIVYISAPGFAADADKFDNLARVALKKQIDFEGEVAALTPTIASQTEVVNKLKAGLDSMKGKLDELKAKRDELVSRARIAEAQGQVQDAIKSIDITDPTSELGRFEDKIRREEAKVRGAAELAESSLDAQFEDLEDAESDAEIEARLAGLKGTGA
jgi:phage shock protein A